MWYRLVQGGFLFITGAKRISVRTTSHTGCSIDSKPARVPAHLTANNTSSNRHLNTRAEGVLSPNGGTGKRFTGEKMTPFRILDLDL